LQRLFDWDDGVKRRWEHVDFRLLARECYAVLRDSASEYEAEAWRKTMGRRATLYITIMPRYERDKLRILEKASPNNSEQVQEARRLGGKQYIWIGAFPTTPPAHGRVNKGGFQHWKLCCSLREERFVRACRGPNTCCTDFLRWCEYVEGDN